MFTTVTFLFLLAVTPCAIEGRRTVFDIPYTGQILSGRDGRRHGVGFLGAADGHMTFDEQYDTVLFGSVLLNTMDTPAEPAFYAAGVFKVQEREAGVYWVSLRVSCPNNVVPILQLRVDNGVNLEVGSYTYGVKAGVSVALELSVNSTLRVLKAKSTSIDGDTILSIVRVNGSTAFTVLISLPNVGDSLAHVGPPDPVPTIMSNKNVQLTTSDYYNFVLAEEGVYIISMLVDPSTRGTVDARLTVNDEEQLRVIARDGVRSNQVTVMRLNSQAYLTVRYRGHANHNDSSCFLSAARLGGKSSKAFAGQLSDEPLPFKTKYTIFTKYSLEQGNLPVFTYKNFGLFETFVSNRRGLYIICMRPDPEPGRGNNVTMALQKTHFYYPQETVFRAFSERGVPNDACGLQILAKKDSVWVTLEPSPFGLIQNGTSFLIALVANPKKN